MTGTKEQKNYAFALLEKAASEIVPETEKEKIILGKILERYKETFHVSAHEIIQHLIAKQPFKNLPFYKIFYNDFVNYKYEISRKELSDEKFEITYTDGSKQIFEKYVETEGWNARRSAYETRISGSSELGQ